MKFAKSFLSVVINFLLGLDQTLNTLVWLRSEGFGLADETLSARAWRLRDDSRAYKFINFIFFWQENHCLDSFIAEMERKHLPSIYKKQAVKNGDSGSN